LRARLAVAPVTAVDLHLDIVAEQAVELLFEHMADPATPRSATAPEPRLVVRGSSSIHPSTAEGKDA